MTRDSLKEWLLKDPFEPFEIQTVTGRAFQVCEPASVALGQLSASIVIAGTDRTVRMDLESIRDVKPLQHQGM